VFISLPRGQHNYIHKQRQRWSSSTLTARISIRPLAVPLAAEDAGAGCLLPEDVNLEAVVLRG
jgi:hypothetical protein